MIEDENEQKYFLIDTQVMLAISFHRHLRRLERGGERGKEGENKRKRVREGLKVSGSEAVPMLPKSSSNGTYLAMVGGSCTVEYIFFTSKLLKMSLVLEVKHKRVDF